MSVRMQYAAGVGAASGALTSQRRYEYDGLNLLRIDELCDANGNGTIDTGEETWRKVEVNTHKPGSLGALIGKRVYVYSDAADSSPNSSNDYTYTYDALGNVQVVYKASGTVGQEAYFFAQDAFGNELSGDANIPASNRTNLLGGATWASARTAGITEHQTGKIQSAFSGLQHFGARWYDPVVGRFVGKDGATLGNPTNHISQNGSWSPYDYSHANPVSFIDIDGFFSLGPEDYALITCMVAAWVRYKLTGDEVQLGKDWLACAEKHAPSVMGDITEALRQATKVGIGSKCCQFLLENVGKIGGAQCKNGVRWIMQNGKWIPAIVLFLGVAEPCNACPEGSCSPIPCMGCGGPKPSSYSDCIYCPFCMQSK